MFVSVAGADRMRWVPHRKVERHLGAGAGIWTLLRPGFFAQNFQGGYLEDISADRRVFVPAGRELMTFASRFE